MSYGDFSLRHLLARFALSINEQARLFATIPAVAASDYLSATLMENIPLALAIHTEKARSEMIIAPILIELRKLTGHRISLFSGTEFNVDPEHGLTGVCDYLISGSAEQLFIKRPMLMIVEAKNENIKAGLAQCIAEMVAAQLFNEREGQPVGRLYGAVTTGTNWKFLILDGNQVSVDLDEYYIDNVGKIMGILLSMVAP
jgi:hypothetical protein